METPTKRFKEDLADLVVERIRDGSFELGDAEIENHIENPGDAQLFPGKLLYNVYFRFFISICCIILQLCLIA